jgi:hypothetical protein
MISISLDDSAASLRAFVNKSGLHWTHVFGEAGGARRTAEAYGAHAIPFVVLLDPQGRAAAVDLRGPEMAETIGDLLDAAKDGEKTDPAGSEPATTQPTGGDGPR